MDTSTPTYDPSGSYVAIAGLIVSVLGYFHIVASASGIVAIIGGVAALYGIITTAINHKAVAVAGMKMGAVLSK